jgi:hypothetical protein
MLSEAEKYRAYAREWRSRISPVVPATRFA